MERFLERKNIVHAGGNWWLRTCRETIQQLLRIFENDLSLLISCTLSRWQLSPTTPHKYLQENAFYFVTWLKLFNSVTKVINEDDLALHIIALRDRVPTFNTYSKPCVLMITSSEQMVSSTSELWGYGELTVQKSTTHRFEQLSYDMMRYIKKKSHRPLRFKNENVTGKGYWKMLNDFAFPHFRSLTDYCIFRTIVLFPTNQTNSLHIWSVRTEMIALKKESSFLATTISSFDLFRFLFMRLYQIKNVYLNVEINRRDEKKCCTWDMPIYTTHFLVSLG